MKSTKATRGSTTRPLGKGNPFRDVDSVMRSARACFERYGVEKTRLEDIANMAGISRPLLYKLFDGREGLMDAIVNYELKQLTEKQKKKMKNFSSFSEVLVQGAIIGIKLAREDAVLMDLLTHSTTDHLPSLLLDTDQPAHKLTLAVWQPHFERARHSGELPVQVHDDDLMEWLMSIQYMFLLRKDVNYKRMEDLLVAFFAPVFQKNHEVS